MQDLLFLGQVPFTNFYINFWAWLAMVITGAPLAVYAYRRRRGLRAWLLAAYVAWLIRRHQLAS